MSRKIFINILVFSLLFLPKLFASHPLDKYLFVRNEGQWEDSILYKADIPGGYLCITPKGLEYLLYDTRQLDHLRNKNKQDKADQLRTTPSLINSQKIAYSFNTSLSASNVIASSPEEQTFNYFLGNDASRWRTGVKAYKEIYIRNVFENIDFRICSLDQALKYEYIVKANGDPGKIRLNYQGASSVEVLNRELHLKTAFGHFKEFEPFTYQKSGDQKRQVRSRFKMSGGAVYFELGEYDKSKELIIDPELVFSTYSGSASDNWSHTATYDSKGNLYAAGTVFGPNFPVTAGSLQEKLGGASGGGGLLSRTDIVIIKYSDDGSKILYSTFLGGQESEVPHSLIVNSKDQLVVFGTTSSINFPTSSNGYDKTYNGGVTVSEPQNTTGISYLAGSDIFVTLISEDGKKILGSTYVGGSGNDGLNDHRVLSIRNYGDEFRGEVYVDKDDKIYVASVTSSENFPLVNSSGPIHSFYDAVTFRLNGDCSALEFSTYIGGNDYDAGYGIRVNSKGEIFVCGVTKSKDFGPTASAYKKDFGGEMEGFVVKIADGKIISKTYLGTPNSDIALLLDIDKESNVYVFGLTTGSYPVSSGVYSNQRSGQFIHCLDNQLSKTIFSSVFGTGRGNGRIDIVPTAFLVNDCGNIYVAGWGGKVNVGNGYNEFSTTTGLPVTRDAFKSTTTGSNYYIAIFEKNFKSLLYGTFFGSNAPPVAEDERGDHLDGGTCRFDKNGIIYHSACVCKAGNFVEFPLKNAVQSNHNNSNCNMAAFKFNIDALLAKFNLTSGTLVNMPELCAPAKVTFDNKSVGAVTYQWKINDKAISTSEHINYVFSDSGYYAIKLKAFNNVICKATDSTTRFIRVKSFNSSAKGDTTICTGALVQLGATGGDTYKWAPVTGLSDPNIANPTANVQQSVIYEVTISNSECTVKREVNIRVEDTKADFKVSENKQICSGSSVLLTASGLADKFVWSSAGMADSVKNSILIRPSKTSTYTVQGFYKDGCKPKKEVLVSIDNSVKPDFEVAYEFDCNKPSVINFNNLTGSSASKFEWLMDSGERFNTESVRNYQAREDKVYQVTLKAYSALGCEFTIQKNIDLSKYDGLIPNVITPNNDGKNDSFVVGFPGIKLQIYDAWGRIILNTQEYENNWGKNAVPGTYYYLLNLPDGKACKGWLKVIK